MFVPDKPPQPVVATQPTNVTFESIIAAPYVTPAIRQSLVASNFILIPDIDIRTDTGPTFPEATERLFRYLVDNAPPSLRPEIAIADDKYVEVSFHTDITPIATFITTSVALPIALGVVSNWLYSHLGSRSRRSTIKAKVIVIKPGAALQIDYEGSSAAFAQTVESAAGLLQKPDD